MSFRKRILILDDDFSTLLLIKNILLSIDPYLALVTATSAEMAYFILNEAKCDGIQFDLIVADINLPGSSGLLLWEVATKRFNVEFLFISGMEAEKWKEQFGKFSQTPHFLPKPITELNLREFWTNRYPKIA